METTEAEQSLRQAFWVVNSEAKIVPPMVLEAYVDEFFREFGPDRLLQIGEQLGVASGDNTMRTADAIRQALRTEEGRAVLRRCIAEKQEYAGQCSAKLQQLAQVWGFGEEWGDPSGQPGLSPAESGVATADMVEKFLQSRRGFIDDNSLTSYGHTLTAFAKHCPVFPTTPEELEHYFARFNGGRGAASAYPVIKLLYDFAEKRCGMPNPMKLIQRPRFKEEEPTSFSLDELRAVDEACRDDREMALVHLEGGHGFRPNETISVSLNDIGERDIFVAEGKVRKEFMPLLPETKEILLSLGAHGDNGAVFVGRSGRRLSDRMAYNIVAAVLKRAGVNRRGVTPYTLRHSFSTLAQENGMEFVAAQRLMRHRKGTMTEHYTHLSREYLRQQLEKYSPIRLINRQTQSGDEFPEIFSCST